MTDQKYTAIVIGAGSGGLTVAIGLAGIGKHVLLVEADDVGGDCTNLGCIPSKTLLAQANRGIAAPDALQHVRTKRDDLRDLETEEMHHLDGITLVFGRAKLLGGGEVEITPPDGLVTIERAEHVVISTGSSPRLITVDGLDEDRMLDNTTLWDLTDAPEHLVIVGGGAIGVEMATAFRDLGSKVTIVEMQDRLLAGLDPELSEVVAQALTARGINVRLGVRAERFDAASNELFVTPVSSNPGASVVDVDRVLVAVGRLPRSDGLGLDDLGVDLAPITRHITIDDWGRTNVDNVWAVGDVTGRTLTTHGANAYGRRVIQAIGLPLVPRVGGPPTIPAAVYCRPQVAWVGAALDELEDRADRLITLRQDLAAIDRGYTDDTKFGSLVVHAERLTGKIVRAAIVGPGAAEVIGLFTLAIDQDISLHKIFRMVHPYPAYAGAVGQIADDFMRQTLPNLPQESLAWLRAIPRGLVRRLAGIGRRVPWLGSRG